MRRVAVLLMLIPAVQFHAASAGAIADQFGHGYGGMAWATPLASLVGMLPGGDHYFSSLAGERLYTVKNDDPLFGIPREGMRIQYHFGKTNRLRDVAVIVPYERREQLLASLVSMFGSYNNPVTIGRTIIYAWPQDHGIWVAVRASVDATNGILELWIDHEPQDVPGTQSK